MPGRIGFALRALIGAALALAFVVPSFSPVAAKRPLPDSGKWDRTFALYARDIAVPWKRIAVRLDTYSGAPVDFAAYAVDPADVLVAGGSRVRAVDTSHRTPVARWRFTPPGGLRYTPNDVEVPLQNREGFFVVEARRGDAVQQAWLDITRAGLLTKESPGGIVLYAADLGSGKALSGMRITYLVGASFQYGTTDVHGIARWTAAQRPRFALAEWGKSKTFVSFLPQAPVPSTLVGVRADRANVRAGEHVRIVGFARKRAGTAYRAASGDAHVSIVAKGRTLASAQARLDAAGAFGAELALPADAVAGDAAVLASYGGTSGGAAIHVDGVGDVVLSVAAACGASCAPDALIPVTVSAKLADGSTAAGRDVRVRVVRSPHVIAPGSAEDGTLWGTTQIADVRVKTDDLGIARYGIPAPTDGLPSTYGIVAAVGASTASARVVAPTARIALAVSPQRADLDIGDPASIDVRGFDATDGRPASGLAVRLRLVHGPTVQEQPVVLDADGRAHAVFRNVVPGTNLAYALADVDGRPAMDVNAVTVAAQALLGARARRSAEARITTDKTRYRVGERLTADASLSGALGDAFVDFEGARAMGEQTVATSGGRASASFTVPETVGDAAIGVAFVRDGAIEYATQRIAIDGPGHVRVTSIAADRASYAPGSTAHLTIADGGQRSDATVAIRLADARSAGGASFEDAAAVLSGTGTTTQNPTSSDPAWHASVAPTRSTAVDLSANERTSPAAETLGAASERALVWRIDRGVKERFDLTLPQTPGRYVVSLLKVSDDGDVGAATLALEVR
jgi:Alpha-2-macroglobulin bait region domain